MRKPFIRIEPRGVTKAPREYIVKWRGRGYRNRSFSSFQEALDHIGTWLKRDRSKHES